MIVKFKRLHKDAVLPKYQTEGASGFDFHALEETKIKAQETVIVRTGWGVELPVDEDMLFEMQVRPRGGTSAKTPLRVANSPGTVDVDYRGEVGIIMTNIDPIFPYTIKKGERIAQGVICPVMRCKLEEVEELTETKRGTGAYNSTGVN